MVLNQVQENIYDVIAQNSCIRSNEISRLLNQSQERVRKELSLMVLSGVVDGRVNNGYSLNITKGGISKCLDRIVLKEVSNNLIVLNNPEDSDLILYQTLYPHVCIAVSFDGEFESIYFASEKVNGICLYESDLVSSLDFSNEQVYVILNNDHKITGYINKEVYEEYFLDILRGVC